MKSMLRALALFALLATPAAAQNVLFPANQGDMIVKGATTWGPVPGGTAGYILQSNGPTAAPVWSNSLPLNFNLPPIPTNRVFGNVSGVQAVPTAITVNQWLDTIGYDTLRTPTNGSMIVKEPATGTWQALTPSPNAGWALTSGGAGQAPVWAPLASSGNILATRVTINPPASTNDQALIINQTGSTTGQSGPLVYNLLTITHQAPVSGSGFDNYGLFNKQAAGLRINFNATGALDATASGVVFATRDTTTAENEVIGGNFTVYSTANTPTSNLYGGVSYVALAAGGAKGRIVGHELDVGASPSATLLERVGLGITAIDRKIGTNQDTAIAIYNGSGNNDAAWKTIIQFDHHGGFNPVATDTKFFSSRAAYTIQDIFAASNITVTGNILDFPHVKLTGPGLLTLNATSSAAPGPLSAGLVNLVTEGVAYINVDAIGAAKESAIVLRTARGTAASPSATLQNDLLGAFVGLGRGDTGYGTTSGAAIFMFANQNWTGTGGSGNQGARMAFYTTPDNSPTKVLRMQIENDGGMTLPNTVTGGSKGAGTVNASGGYYVGGQPMGMVLLNTLTASNSATLDDTTSITSAYDLYYISFENVVPATNAVHLVVQFSKNAGGAWLTTGYINQSGGATDSVWVNATAALDNTAGVGLTGDIYLRGPNRTDTKKMITGTGAMITGGAIAAQSTRGWYNTDNDALNALRFKMDSGNISAGKIRIWGVKTS